MEFVIPLWLTLRWMDITIYRIQSFPDDFFFEGSRSAAFKQIGNAVPVILAEKIGLKIKKLLKNEDGLR